MEIINKGPIHHLEWRQLGEADLVLGCADKEGDNLEEDVFLWQMENMMLKSVSLHGVSGITQVFLVSHNKVVIN